jgi:MFS family permease
MILARIRLAVERDETDRQARHSQQTKRLPVSFWAVMAIATLAACSVQVLMWIVPQHISHIGADLTRGGKDVSLFSLAGGLGGVLLAPYAARRGELPTVTFMLAAGIPFILAYVILPHYLASVLLLAVGGFFCFGAYPIMVSIARHSKGPNLGRRMGLIVGGIWLGACLLPMLLGPVAERLGTGFVIFLTPIGFTLALALSVRTAIKCSKKNPDPKDCPHY